MITPKTHYLIELTKLIGRLGHALELDDTAAYLGILRQIRELTDRSIQANLPRLPFRVVDILDNADDDDEL